MKKSTKIILGITGFLVVFIVVAFSTPTIETHKNYRMMIPASKEVAWEVISDVKNYHRYATGLSNVTVVSGSGKGMVRSCSDELGQWLETCTAWNEGSSYSFDVEPGSGFPYPFKMMKGTWSVNSIDENFSEISIEFNYQFPYRWMKWMFSDDTHEVFNEGDEMLLDNWEKAILMVDVDLAKIINKHFISSGSELLSKVETQIWKGRSNDTEFVLYQKRPGKARLDAKKDTVEFSQIFDGKTSWIKAPWLGSVAQKSTYPDNRTIKTFGEFDTPVYYAFRQDHQLKYDGFEYVESQPAYKVSVSYPNNERIEFFIHATSGLLIKQIDYYTGKKGEEVNMITSYSAYEDVDGIQVPFKMEQTFSFEDGNNQITIENVTFDEPVNESIFSF